MHLGLSILCSTTPSWVMSGKKWGFELHKIQMHHLLGMPWPVIQIPTIPHLKHGDLWGNLFVNVYTSVYVYGDHERSIQVSQDGFMLRLVCMFLGCDMPIQLVLSSVYDNWRIVSSCTDSRHGLPTKYVTFYGWTNRLTCFSTFNLPIKLLLYINKHLTTSIIKY